MSLGILTHRSDGDGEPLLLLNGGLMTIASWEPIAKALALRRRVVRCDFRGQLLSPGASPPTLEAHADDLERLLDALAIESADLLGTSFGGAVALVFGARRPERVRRLVVMTATASLNDVMRGQAAELERSARAAAAGGDGAALFRLVASGTFSAPFLARQAPTWVDERAALFSRMPREWFEGIAGLMAALATLDLEDLLPRISSPTLIVGAELDRVFPVENSRALSEAIPGAKLEILQGVGHGAVVEAPDRVISLVEDFLAQGQAQAVFSRMG